MKQINRRKYSQFAILEHLHEICKWHKNCFIFEEMQPMVTYIKLFGLVTVALFILLSSGFTLIVHSCQMSEKTSCIGMNTGCEMSAPSNAAPDGPSINQVSPGCCASKILGGLSTAVALLEKQSLSVHQKLVAVILPDSVSDLYKVSNIYVHLSQLASYGISPPSVEKYVLYSTLLI